MTITPQGQLYLCKTPLENDYKNQLTFSNETAQLSYFNSTIQHTLDNYTYIKKDNAVNVGINIDEIIDCNYLFYKNTGFTTKYYFCFIKNMEYVNENCTRINFETDCFQTWYFQIDYKPTFVEREHVSDDTIGLHTIPENLELGEYTNITKVKFGVGSCHAVVCLTEDPFKTTGSYPYNVVNSIPSGLHYFVVGDFTSVNFIGWVTDWASTNKDLSLIQSILIVPDSMTGYDEHASNYWSYAITGNLNYAPYHKLDEVITGAITMNTLNFEKQYTSIDGYIPKNNKLFTWPYNFMIIDNNGGHCEEYRYEDFSTSMCVFETKGSITPGCSIKTTPKNYKGIADNYSESINALKLPVGSWQGDVYTNWLTQNAVNIGVNMATSTAGLLSSAFTGNVATGTSSILGIASTLGSIYEHSRIPNQVYGNTNSGDVTYSLGESTFTAYARCIKNEYAQIIDNFFSMFGYKINKIKIPNITGRTNWNYVKTINCNFDGNIPQIDLNIIKAMFNNGVTLWHNPSNMYNYSLDNSIVV